MVAVPRRRASGIRAAPPLPSPRPSPLATPGLRPVGAARAGPRPGAACPGGGPRDAAAPPAAARFRPPPGSRPRRAVAPPEPAVGSRRGRGGRRVAAVGGTSRARKREAWGPGRRAGRRARASRAGGRGRPPRPDDVPPPARPPAGARAPPLPSPRGARAPAAPSVCAAPPPSVARQGPSPPPPARAPSPGVPPRGAPSPLVLGSLSRPRGDSRARVRARALRDATSDQTWRPAEFKHISQRRKRN